MKIVENLITYDNEDLLFIGEDESKKYIFIMYETSMIVDKYLVIEPTEEQLTSFLGGNMDLRKCCLECKNKYTCERIDGEIGHLEILEGDIPESMLPEEGLYLKTRKNE